ncbi:hypothetical protein DHEL01_v206248 [Diaporthe helianthi]|uniref:PD-(D/E)XK nuclease-like domain-containing protein n=1 Tax=Diaporthe helianthi TaxID=158607 RepID=A0A2P5HYM2_DIAHE|nr:hypothetical protein DHEL01_v206248 [Diaporthe helianthi]
MTTSFQVRKQSIDSWLDAIEPTSPEQQTIEPASPEHREPPTKRVCRRPAQNTPPPTEDSMMASDKPMTPVRRGARKRTNEEAGGELGLDDEGLDETPRPRRPYLSPRKRQVNSLKRSRAILGHLQKPIQILAVPDYADALQSLPADVIPLYEQISTANEFEGVIPYEVRDIVKKRVRDKPQYFRAPNPADNGKAMAVLASVYAIKHRATEAQVYQRDEIAWNTMVHSPLLYLVFSSDVKVDTTFLADVHDTTQSTAIHVRAEPVMSASIAGDSIPLLRGSSSSNGTEPACSVSIESLLVSERSLTNSNLSLSMMRSRGVKVDYVLAVEFPEDTLLRKTIKEAIQDSPLPHINQTAYLPLKESPIAVAIETKTDTSAQDPLVQLGIWTGAWYKHMYDLREYLAGPGPKPRLVSVPVIQVVGHQWQVYFAQDMGESIIIHGPIPLGSTANILSIYGLLASLEAVKQWVEGAFCTGLEAWLTPEAR